MRWPAITIVGLVGVASIALAHVSSAASLDDSCPPGFGVVAASPDTVWADMNADGYVCGIQTDDGTLVVVDNGPPDTNVRGCPPAESGFAKVAWPATVPPDRNNDGYACLKFAGEGFLPKAVVIDNNVPPR